MYDPIKVKKNLIHLIGWRRNIDTNGVQLVDLTQSATGLYFNDEHPLLTIDNLISVAPNFDQIAESEGDLNTKFNDWLKQKTEAGIIRALDKWINLKFKKKIASCDYTELIVDQKLLFKTIISKQVAMDMLRQLAYNPNVNINRNQSNINIKQILYEIDGDSRAMHKGGLKKEMEDALEAITLDFTGIDKECLPCQKRTVKYRTVGQGGASFFSVHRS